MRRCKKTQRELCIELSDLDLLSFLELRELLDLNQLVSAKWGVLMKLVFEILDFNDQTKISLSKVNVSNPYGFCGCSCLC